MTPGSHREARTQIDGASDDDDDIIIIIFFFIIIVIISRAVLIPLSYVLIYVLLN